MFLLQLSKPFMSSTLDVTTKVAWRPLLLPTPFVLSPISIPVLLEFHSLPQWLLIHRRQTSVPSSDSSFLIHSELSLTDDTHKIYHVLLTPSGRLLYISFHLWKLVNFRPVIQVVWGVMPLRVSKISGYTILMELTTSLGTFPDCICALCCAFFKLIHVLKPTCRYTGTNNVCY